MDLPLVKGERKLSVRIGTYGPEITSRRIVPMSKMVTEIILVTLIFTNPIYEPDSSLVTALAVWNQKTNVASLAPFGQSELRKVSEKGR